jgi:ATP-dependent helicase/nuclease subunit B
VTEIETWNRDPYAIYARHVLKLAPLSELDEAPGAADRGTVIHAALQRFIEEAPEGAETAEAAAARLIDIGEALFAELPEAPEIKAFWWRRFVRAANWFATTYMSERATIARSFTEKRGKLHIDAPGGDFILSGRADRIDLLKDGTLAILDYKTGVPPGEKEVMSGLAPQLPLEAAMAAKGGFAEGGVEAAPASRLAYISLPGGEPPGKVQDLRKKPPEILAGEALAGLTRKIAEFDKETTPYLSRPHAKFISRYAEYDHLARVMEWARDGAGEGE